MDIRTGEVRMFEPNETIPNRFTEIPEPLQKEATSFLGGRKSAFVDTSDSSDLAVWARGERRTQADRAKTKMQKASRKKNRGR